MLPYIRYLNFINLSCITNHIIGRVIAESNADVELEFRQACKWRPLKEGFEEAKINRKPIFLFIQKIGCPACVKLKRKFCKSIKLIELSNQFVMITLEVTKKELSEKQKFQPDGKYVPRILFFTPDGELIKDAYNRDENCDKEAKFFYSSPPQIIDTMIFVLRNSPDRPITTDFSFESRKHYIDDPDDEILRPTLLE